ncbi:hypothetical protein PCC9214_01487 [Planktothrix tepida]|uniref:Uncharacterized protein n=1 Tax=Planktothrix tepida PCC 9214 TaxID=671072 RepID=A0A1J1LH17_9CYAN|nr:hypothetical protein [Planktothrix tepida]CAD5934135.1 hypothetical protein PCC9214_01487 [Planktothrix tepida]CUR31771.1 conserved hypothetical protein [Planktothrix tepida PCC 9214]
MPNYNPNTEGLTQSKWVNKPVKVYRLPEPIADDVLAYAHKLDKGENDRSTVELDTAIKMLTQSLTLPANKGGAIKTGIKKALEILAKG